MAGIEFNRERRRWEVSVVDSSGAVHDIGDFKTRTEANDAYKAAHARINPPPEPPAVDPAKHHGLVADSLDTSGPEGGV